MANDLLRDPFDGKPWPGEDIMSEDVPVGDIAQHALGDAFAQLVMVGSAGAARCFRYTRMPYEGSQRVDVAEARALLTAAHAALQYAERQLQLLDFRPKLAERADDGDEPDEEPEASPGPIVVGTNGHMGFSMRASGVP